MKLKDIINAAGHRLDWINFHWDWNIDDNEDIIPVTPININMDSEISIHYQWFHHFDQTLNRDEAWNAIKEHDYETFYKWYKMFEDDQWVYFPSKASIFIDDECIGEVCIVYDPRVFSLITDQDCECG